MMLQLSPRWPLYLLGSLILLLSLVTIVGERGALHLWRLAGEKSRIDEQNSRMQRDNELLRQKVFRVRHDNHYLEKLAREELNMARRGEVVYRFSKAEARRNPGTVNQPSEPLPSKEPSERR
ncbi:MAG: FtsB family cell division protein [Candidatus Binatia bacterium]